jgi:hypothetical protein
MMHQKLMRQLNSNSFLTQTGEADTTGIAGN